MPLLDLIEFEDVNRDFHADYVIVGGGTSGLVLANRLSEDPSIKVVCIEAGTDLLGDPRLTIPMLSAQLYENDDYDWGFITVPQPQLGGRRLGITRGRTLGGTSATHHGSMKPASRIGMDAWEKMGNPGWNWKSFEPYMYKGTTLHAPKGEVAQHVHYPAEAQGNGSLHISYCENLAPYHHAWFETLEKMAYFDDDVEARPNLYVVIEALADRVLLEQGSDGNDDVVATGVAVSNESRSYTISAGREVILAAGALKTPQLLELSGIGKRDVLAAQGIEPVIVNDNVGENLQSQAVVSFGYEVDSGTKTIDSVTDSDFAEEIMQQYMEDRSGPIGQIFLVHHLMSFKDPLVGRDRNAVLQKILDDCTSAPQRKQVEVLWDKVGDPDEATAEITMQPFQIRPRAGPLKSQMWDCKEPGNFVSVGTTLLHPMSRGSVHISSADPHVQPRINSNMLTHVVDRVYLAKHLINTDSIFDEEPMASILKKGGKRLHCDQKLKDMDFDEVLELCKELVVFSNDICGTCAMLPRDEYGVVDPELKVYGTRNLRVVGDAMFPLLPRGDSVRTVFAVAERSADIILGRTV
ncbi:hypothetical protein KEM52_001149 [Ascosphaera acerosa]|nr:hypothetical protein KEM52_001149 [Ascosphaera acerosa]